MSVQAAHDGATVTTVVTPLTVHGQPAPRDRLCPACDLDRHTCPGCGDWLHHGTACCALCVQEVRRGVR